MEKSEALRSIQYDLVEYIQAKVLVDSDNAGQIPLSFIYKEKAYVIREDRKMLLNMTMKRLVDFHGHLCPDLVIGAKLSEYIQQLVAGISRMNVSISILAQNCTSAIDAIQILLGATFGNQRLQVMDLGRHVYSLVINDTGISFMFSLKQQKYGDEDEFDNLEQKIMTSGITLEEAVYFQKLMDGRIENFFQ